MEMDKQKNLGQGDVIVSLCNVISSNGKQLKKVSERAWQSITLTESMGLIHGDTQFVSGEITILDSTNIMNEMNLVGDEVIELKFKTPQKGEINFTGKVYNVSVSDFDRARALTLKYCSTEKLVSDQLKINAVYRDMPYSEIAKKIFAPLNVLGKKKIYAEPTKNKGNIVANNKSPIDVINQLGKAAVSENYQGASYVFFEQIEPPAVLSTGNRSPSGGMFQFVSLEKLIDPSENKPTMLYYYDAPPENQGSVESLVRIKSYKVLNMPNLATGIRGGMFGSMAI